MKLTIKDEGVLIFFILVPLGYPLLYSWIYTTEAVREVPVTVVDMSHSHESREFIHNLDGTPDANVVSYSNNMNDAKLQLAQQKAHGIIYFPEDFATNLNRGQQAHVGVYVDMSLMLAYKAIYQSSQSVATAINSKIQISKAGNYTNRDDELTTEPLDVNGISIFNAPIGYGNFLIPPVLILILQQTLIFGIGLSAGTEREKNAHAELVPVSEHYAGIFRIVLGKSLCYFMIYLVMGAYNCLVVPRLFHFTSMMSYTTFFGFLIPFLLSVIFFGMFISCFVRYRENILLMLVFTSVPFLFLSGASWPQSAIPEFWQWIGDTIPSTFGIRGFIRINTMRSSLADILPEFRGLWLQAGIYFLLTCFVYRFRIRAARRKAGLNPEEDDDE
jgi:ABC-2 type transport system permease protein